MGGWQRKTIIIIWDAKEVTQVPKEGVTLLRHGTSPLSAWQTIREEPSIKTLECVGGGNVSVTDSFDMKSRVVILFGLDHNYTIKWLLKWLLISTKTQQLLDINFKLITNPLITAFGFFLGDLYSCSIDVFICRRHTSSTRGPSK